MKLIYIEWEDAISNSSWHTEQELKRWANYENSIVKEVGWLYKETKKHIVLVSRQLREDIDETESDYGRFGLLQKIPKTWIQKRIDLTKYIDLNAQKEK